MFDIFPTTFMLRVSFSPVPECVEGDCWNRAFLAPRGTRNAVIVIVVVVLYRSLHFNIDIGTKILTPR